MEKRKLVHLEVFRILAIYLVMFNHTGQNGFFFFSIAQDSPLFWLYLFMSIACKVAVPLFYMVSGALLLKKEEGIGAVYKKRFLRMFIILVITSLLYTAYDCINAGTSFDIIAFLKTLYGSRASVALWYLYSYLALLMMLPLLRKLARNLTLHEYVYLACMSLLFIGIIPILQYRLMLDEVTLYSHLKGALFTTTSIVFFLMGYCFEYVLPEKYYTAKNACIGIVLSLLCIGICCYMTVFRAEITGEWKESATQVFHNSLIAIPTYTIYFCGKLLFMKKQIPEKVQKVVCLVGSTTFGIYLLERILRTETKNVFTVLRPLIRTVPACLVWIAAAFLLGFVITLIIKKVPVIGKYI